MPKKDFVAELKWRNMLHDITPGAAELLQRETVKGYIGFDPTSDSLGVGNLVQVMTLLHFQQCGHKPIALVGGATGMVGDPSGKSHERSMLDEDTLMHNLACQRKQLERFLDFDCGEISAEIVNNYDWFKDFSLLRFLREVGKNITVSNMYAKDSVQSRLETGMSFTEFTYQLMQGYDFYYLWKNYGVKLQMGGSDQWGNIVTGTELIRKKEGGEAHAITTPLIKKADGTKFGKTEKGNVWLDARRTSPYRFYQFWINASDEDVVNYIRIFSLKSREEIEALEQAHAREPHLRILQKALAEEVTERVHSADDLRRAKQTTEILFGTSFEAFKQLSPQEIEDAFDEDAIFRVPAKELETCDAVSLLSVVTGIYPSKGEARKALQSHAVSINKQKINIDYKPTPATLLHNKYLLVQKGKKNYYLLVAT
ncbi:MAG: tyrosine--tRNA ligase [Chitinophagales bacterium]|nr:tyrosine--tRNA ligase [Chitinophagales bacterium]MDW8418081.1 tyrosine--tRNA ligase [Chitinophagales bacterium]